MASEILADFGRLKVPENRDKADSRLIELAFVRLKGSGEGRSAPMIYLAGGPGGSSTGFADSERALSNWAPVLNACDVIFLDQRATGKSTPLLRYEIDAEPPVEMFADRDIALNAYLAQVRKAVKQARADGVDLDGYHSNASADDINDLRKALGLEKLNLFGFSYGSHLALATMRPAR